ncbi:MAG: sugar phosphate isomerase/epimerase [Planctomycetes bacterium]|nr:sugar phosphate isomerase/epimerase [Planctomycetota bacterium]
MRLGVGTYTYPWATGKYTGDNRLPTAALLECAGRLPGVTVVQLCDHSSAETLAGAALDAVTARARELGLVLQVGTRGIDPAHLAAFCDAAQRLGGGLVRSMLPVTGPGSAYDDARAMLREALPRYQQAGVTLALENHDQTPCRVLRRLVEAVGSPSLGICLDPVNSYGIGEDSQRILDTLVPVTACFHAKDYRIDRLDYGLGFAITGTAAGDGLLDLPAILDRFDRAAVTPDIIIEQWTPRQAGTEETIRLESEWAVRGAGYLHGLLRRRRRR